MRYARTWVGLAVFTMLAGARHAAAQAAVASTVWPVSIQSASGTVDVYEPQSESFSGDQLTARAAISVTPAGAPSDQPVFGAIWFDARVSTDTVSRTVTLRDVQVKRVVFPTSDGTQQQQLTQVVQTQLPLMNVTFSLDALTADLSTAQKEQIEATKLSTTPPKIIFSAQPATLVTLDGEPKLQPVSVNNAPNGVLRVVNTPFVMFLDPSKHYFLKAGNDWLTAPDVKGPWGNAPSVPVNITAAAATIVDTAPATPAAAPASGPTAIYVAEEPTELIVTRGMPTYTPLPGNDLLYMSNTASDVFLAVQSQMYYVLLSGRWYTSHTLNGPWTFTPPTTLPPAFAQIPADSPKASVLASVAGTPAAQDARLNAVVPQTAAVPLNTVGPNVSYDGDPNFSAVEGTPLTYAVNSPYSVVCYDGGYFCCDQAIWYTAYSARGPWRVCRHVPDAIYTIPPSCPVYNCRYVYVYRSTPDVVYMGYLPGYTGSYLYDGTVVYGTGYTYSSWYRTYYIPRPCTYGFSARYVPYHGVWAYDDGDYRHERRWLSHEDRDDRHDGWFGPRGYVGYRSLRDDRPDVTVNRNDTHQTNTTIIRNDVHEKNVTINRTVNRINVYQHPVNSQRGVKVTQHVVDSHVQRGAPVNGGSKLLAGDDGQVYRQTNTGWEQRNKAGWSHVDAPAVRPTPVRPGERTGNVDAPVINHGPARIQRPVDSGATPPVITHGPALNHPRDKQPTDRTDRSVPDRRTLAPGSSDAVNTPHTNVDAAQQREQARLQAQQTSDQAQQQRQAARQTQQSQKEQDRLAAKQEDDAAQQQRQQVQQTHQADQEQARQQAAQQANQAQQQKEQAAQARQSQVDLDRAQARQQAGEAQQQRQTDREQQRQQAAQAEQDRQNARQAERQQQQQQAQQQAEQQRQQQDQRQQSRQAEREQQRQQSQQTQEQQSQRDPQRQQSQQQPSPRGNGSQN